MKTSHNTNAFPGIFTSLKRILNGAVATLPVLAILVSGAFGILVIRDRYRDTDTNHTFQIQTLKDKTAEIEKTIDKRAEQRDRERDTFVHELKTIRQEMFTKEQGDRILSEQQYIRSVLDQILLNQKK